MKRGRMVTRRLPTLLRCRLSTESDRHFGRFAETAVLISEILIWCQIGIELPALAADDERRRVDWIRAFGRQRERHALLIGDRINLNRHGPVTDCPVADTNLLGRAAGTVRLVLGQGFVTLKAKGCSRDCGAPRELFDRCLGMSEPSHQSESHHHADEPHLGHPSHYGALERRVPSRKVAPAILPHALCLLNLT